MMPGLGFIKRGLKALLEAGLSWVFDGLELLSGGHPPLKGVRGRLLILCAAGLQIVGIVLYLGLFRPCAWLMRWLRRQIIRFTRTGVGERLVDLVKLPVMAGIILAFELDQWLHPQRVRITEQGENSLTIDLPRWFLFENATKSAVRMRAGIGEGKIPKKLRGQGLRLRPGQKRKIGFPGESFYEIEIEGMDGQRLEQMKLKVKIDRYAD